MEIPLKIWQTYETKILPPKMDECVNKLKTQHPDFEHQLFDATDRREFIQNNYPEEIVVAYDSLIPGAYKADLWRLCVLYIHGGIYMDIKLQFQNDFTLHKFIDKEYFVRDGHKSIYNAFIVVQKRNPILFKSILKIIHNVANKNLGENPWEPTGPKLIGSYYEWDTKLELVHYGPVTNETVRNLEDIIVLNHYDGYRTEQELLNKKYYQNLWWEKNIYSDCFIDYDKAEQNMIAMFS